jgi:hypothetical protein
MPLLILEGTKSGKLADKTEEANREANKVGLEASSGKWFKTPSS